MATLSRRSDHPYTTLREAMNQLFNEAFAPFAAFQTTGQDSLPINVYEDGEKYYLHVLAPGIDLQTAEITTVGDVLTIAVRQRTFAQDNWRQVWQEFTPTEYRRQIRLPIEFDPNQVEASYKDGVLMITVPKAEHSRPRTIKVRAG